MRDVLSGKKRLLVSSFLLFSICGCDQLSGLFNDSSKKSEKNKNDITAQSPASASAAKKDSADAPADVSSSQNESQNIVVKVGNWRLTDMEFKDRLAAVKEFIPDFNPQDKEARRFVLDELIKQQLLVADADKQGLGKNKDLVAAVEEFRRTLLVRELATQLTKDIQATDAEAEEYYNQHKIDFVAPGEWHIREIMAETEEDAKKVLVDLLQGADFGEMAQQNSKSSSASTGGDLGFVSQFAFPEMEGAVKLLEVGGVSSVFKGPDGYYIVKLDEKKDGEQKEFAELKEEIKAGLVMMKQQQMVVGYIDALRQNAKVEINEKLLEELGL